MPATRTTYGWRWYNVRTYDHRYGRWVRATVYAATRLRAESFLDLWVAHPVETDYVRSVVVAS